MLAVNTIRRPSELIAGPNAITSPRLNGTPLAGTESCVTAGPAVNTGASLVPDTVNMTESAVVAIPSVTA